MNNPPSDAWQAVAKLWRQPDAGLSQTFPATSALRQVSLLEGLSDPQVAGSPSMLKSGQQLAQEINELLEHLQLSTAISRCPILALTGQLNAGKSSLLASYLSPHNRQRVLRGISNHSGTHRFVLWLPQVWRDNPELLNVLISLITKLFGHAPEDLADDPLVAAAQYNAQHNTQHHTTGVSYDLLRVPLIAYDAQLDKLQLGLLDCPDIQTGFISAASSASPLAPADLAESRQQQLAHIGRLCSAFIVVCRMNSLHDTTLLQILTTLREAMPGVPRFLAINRVKTRYAPGTVLGEAKELVDRFGVNAVYTAYNFRSVSTASRIPPPPAGMELAGEELPIFFEVKSLSAEEAGSSPNYLFNMGERLDGGALAKANSSGLIAKLKSYSEGGLQWLDKNQRQSQKRVHDARQTVADACYEFMAQHDADGRTVGLRLQASPAIVGQIADSLQRTAPMWMRASLRIDRTARQFQQAISNSASRFKIWHGASQTVTQFAQRFRRGEGAQVVTPEGLAEALRRLEHDDALQTANGHDLLAACESALQRFAQENNSRLDPSELEQWSQQVWRDMSWRDKLWKGTQPLAIMFAPLLAVVLVPFDGGGTAVLVFASTKELLAAAGLAALLGPTATGSETLSIVQRETPWRQLSDLFVICCDSLGLPRPAAPADYPALECGTTTRRLVPSTLSVKLGATPPLVCLWELHKTQVSHLRSALDQC